MISNFKNIQDLERQDHKFCMSLNLDSAKGFDLKNAVYWRCRLSLAKYKLGASYNAQDGAKYNFTNSQVPSGNPSVGNIPHPPTRLPSISAT